MRKINILIFLLLAIALGPLPVQAQENVSIEIDGILLYSDVSPVIKNGRTLVPFRAIAEAMNAGVEWNNDSRSISASKEGQNVVLTIGINTAYINGSPISLDVAPEIINNRTMIPLRFFSEAFNCEVNWKPDTRIVAVKTPPCSMKVVGYYALGDSKTSSWTNLFGTPYPLSSKGHTAIVSDLALGWFSLDENGKLLTKSRTGWQRPEGWEAVLSAGTEYNINSEMVVHMTNEGRVITSLLSNQNAVKQAVREIADEAEYYSGVNLDFEGLGLSEKGEELSRVQDSFSRFVKLLSEELHKQGKTLTLSLHAPNSVYKGYDYEALGEYCDFIIIMAYDYGTKPEPIDMVDEAVTIALRKVPAEKLILGISAPSETSESIAGKISLAKKYNLNGIALWRLGLITQDMWDVLESHILPQ